jgi:preprotein translocase subunit SecA
MAARLSHWRAVAREIIVLSHCLTSLEDAALLLRSQTLRWRAKSRTPLRFLLPEAYALVREAARRVLGKQHFEVQLTGGIALFEGGLAEMQTGEGKTLTATLPTYLRALPGLGCHVVTVNDYLAERDCALMEPVYKLLGMTVGCVLSASDPEDRRHAYDQDITYATSREIGFDFLRDRLKVGNEQDSPQRSVFRRDHSSDGPVQRGHYFALIDEADSVLIDDAGTPLIIGLNREGTAATEALLNWSRESALSMHATDFHFDPDRRDIELTIAGARKIILARKPRLLDGFELEKLYSHVEQALRAEVAFCRGRDYVVTPDEEISIVDEGTGRTLEGRKWQAGLHQAIEAKEKVPITDETGEAARITIQTFFRKYQHLAGMSGTAMPTAGEFRKTYGLRVTSIPTNRRCIRQGLATRVFLTQRDKWNSMIPDIERRHSAGRAILIGTPSVDASEALGERLLERGLDCQILNALFHEQEAEIIAQAGQPGRITIATNMAGRGTDIHLHEDVRACAGLHVIATELHTNRRIDRQLIGRAARQGDPGSFQFWLSLEDELFRFLPRLKRQVLVSKAKPTASGELSAGWLRLFRRLQKTIEVRECKQRRQLLQQERTREKTCLAMGLDPYLEVAD